MARKKTPKGGSKEHQPKVGSSRIAALALDYSKGLVTWQQIADETGLSYGELLIALGLQNLQIPKVTPENRPEQTALFNRVLAEAAAAKLPPSTVGIPASGPLDSKQVRDALDGLLENDPGLRLVVTDLVQFEVSAFPNRFHDVQAVSAFLEQHRDRISIQETTIGKFAIPAMKDQLERGEAIVWQKDLSDLAINCFIKVIGTLNPGESTLMLIEDGWFDENAYVVPGNVRLMSVSNFLAWCAGRGPGSHS